MSHLLHLFPFRICWAALAVTTALSVRAADLRVGLVGLDTSHVISYLELLNNPAAPDHVAGARIVAAFKGGSPDLPASYSRLEGYTRQVTGKYGVKLYDSIDALARDVDAVMITSVDGRPHLEYFRQALAAKKPIFIDKPLTGSLRDAVELVRLARESGVPCFSSSSLRYPLDAGLADLAKIGAVHSAYAFGPSDIEPHHPDLYWYGVHTVESLYNVMGTGCLQVSRTHTADTDVVTGLWPNGRVGTAQGNRNGYHGYGVIAFGAKGIARLGEQHSMKPLTERIVTFFRTGVAPVKLEETLETLAFMEAADESKRRGGAPVTLAEVLKLAQAQP